MSQNPNSGEAMMKTKCYQNKDGRNFSSVMDA